MGRLRSTVESEFQILTARLEKKRLMKLVGENSRINLSLECEDDRVLEVKAECS